VTAMRIRWTFTKMVAVSAIALGLIIVVASMVSLMDAVAPKTASSVIGGPFSLVDDEGHDVTDVSLRGEPSFMFFGYTHCPDVCPTTLFELSEVLRKLPPNSRARGIFVTVDPERDTPAALKDYLSSFDGRIIGLTGSRDRIDPVLKSFRVYSRKVPGDSDDDYSMDHSAIVYLMDKDMRFVAPVDLEQAASASRAIQGLM
jgi:protein SCO1